MAKRGAQVIGEAEAPADKAEHRRIDYKWIVLSVMTIGALMAAIGPRAHDLGIASATLATLRQTGMVTSFALALAVAAGSLPREAMMKLFVGTSVALGSGPMQEFVVGIRHAFVVSAVLCLVAAGLSLVRGREDRSWRARRQQP